MSNMTKEYGIKKGKSVFYATANKNNLKPKSVNSGLKELSRPRIKKVMP